jgi:hypothetical protein
MADRAQEQFAAGYQAALADVARELDQGGEAAAREWINNNRRDG